MPEAIGVPPPFHFPSCAVDAMLLSEGEVLGLTRALRSGVPNAPLMCQLLRSKQWQNNGKLQSDAFEPRDAVSNEEQAF